MKEDEKWTKSMMSFKKILRRLRSVYWGITNDVQEISNDLKSVNANYKKLSKQITELGINYKSFVKILSRFNISPLEFYNNSEGQKRKENE